MQTYFVCMCFWVAEVCTFLHEYLICTTQLTGISHITDMCHIITEWLGFGITPNYLLQKIITQLETSNVVCKIKFSNQFGMMLIVQVCVCARAHTQHILHQIFTALFSEHVLKALSSLETTEEKLAALCKKYTELLDEHRLLQNTHKQTQKKFNLVCVCVELEKYTQLNWAKCCCQAVTLVDIIFCSVMLISKFL